MALKTIFLLRPSSASLLFSALKCKHFSQKPPNSNYKNQLSSLFNGSCHTTISPDPESLDRFLKDLKEKCKSGNVSPDETHYFFDCMIQKQPAPHMSTFTILFTALAKNRHYDTVVSLIQKLNTTWFLPNLIIFNVLLNCLYNLSRV
ncbi:hypothetical protein ACOSP7_021940 [Xanthoceras sorbifolium]